MSTLRASWVCPTIHRCASIASLSAWGHRRVNTQVLQQNSRLELGFMLSDTCRETMRPCCSQKRSERKADTKIRKQSKIGLQSIKMDTQMQSSPFVAPRGKNNTLFPRDLGIECINNFKQNYSNLQLTRILVFDWV